MVNASGWSHSESGQSEQGYESQHYTLAGAAIWRARAAEPQKERVGKRNQHH